MKLRLVAVVLGVLGALFWLRTRGPLDQSGTKGTTTTAEPEATSKASHQPPTAAPTPRATSANIGGSATTLPPADEKTPATEHTSAPASSPEKKSSTAAATTNLPLPRFVGGHRANVPPGGALVMGGWPQTNGNRLLLFASPEPQQDGKSVKISSRFLSVPPAHLRGGSWDRFLTEDNVSKEGGVFTAAEFAETMRQISGFNDVDNLTAPTLVTLYGAQAQIMVASSIRVSNGQVEQIQDGVSQAIIARQVEGTEDVDLAVTAAQFGSNP